MHRIQLAVGVLAGMLGWSAEASAVNGLESQRTEAARESSSLGIPSGGAYVPAGTLYDNEQSKANTSLTSQEGLGMFRSRSADDFRLSGTGCASGWFDITGIRIQMVQADAAPQAFGVEIYADNGAGTAPTPANAITPIASATQTSQALLGPFGTGSSVFEASFTPVGMRLAADTTYWISGFGANAVANSTSFNNYFASSSGSGETPDNGVLIAPGAGVPAWTTPQVVVGGDPIAFSFAIDGACALGGPSVLEIPALGARGLLTLSTLLALATVLLLRRRRAT